MCKYAQENELWIKENSNFGWKWNKFQIKAQNSSQLVSFWEIWWPVRENGRFVWYPGELSVRQAIGCIDCSFWGSCSSLLCTFVIFHTSLVKIKYNGVRYNCQVHVAQPRSQGSLLPALPLGFMDIFWNYTIIDVFSILVTPSVHTCQLSRIK